MITLLAVVPMIVAAAGWALLTYLLMRRAVWRLALVVFIVLKLLGK